MPGCATCGNNEGYLEMGELLEGASARCAVCRFSGTPWIYRSPGRLPMVLLVAVLVVLLFAPALWFVSGAAWKFVIWIGQ